MPFLFFPPLVLPKVLQFFSASSLSAFPLPCYTPLSVATVVALLVHAAKVVVAGRHPLPAPVKLQNISLVRQWTLIKRGLFGAFFNRNSHRHFSALVIPVNFVLVG